MGLGWSSAVIGFLTPSVIITICSVFPNLVQYWKEKRLHSQRDAILKQKFCGTAVAEKTQLIFVVILPRDPVSFWNPPPIRSCPFPLSMARFLCKISFQQKNMFQQSVENNIFHIFSYIYLYIDTSIAKIIMIIISHLPSNKPSSQASFPHWYPNHPIIIILIGFLVLDKITESGNGPKNWIAQNILQIFHHRWWMADGVLLLIIQISIFKISQINRMGLVGI